jgi:hypothetical protein
VRWIDELSGDGFDRADGGHLVLWESRAGWHDVELLRILEAHRQRATYAARAGCTLDDARTRGVHLGTPSPRTSWIVEERGFPSHDFPRNAYHPRLTERPGILRTPAELREWVLTHFVAADGRPYVTKTPGWPPVEFVA